MKASEFQRREHRTTEGQIFDHGGCRLGRRRSADRNYRRISRALLTTSRYRPSCSEVRWRTPHVGARNSRPVLTRSLRLRTVTVRKSARMALPDGGLPAVMDPLGMGVLSGLLALLSTGYDYCHRRFRTSRYRIDALRSATPSLSPPRNSASEEPPTLIANDIRFPKVVCLSCGALNESEYRFCRECIDGIRR